MGTLFFLMALLCLCNTSKSQDCRQGLLVNVDFTGSDIATYFSPDAEHCQYLCTQHPTCQFFTFLRADWVKDHRQFHCFLKSTSSGNPKIQIALYGHTSGFSLKPCPLDPEPCLTHVYQNVDFPGANYRTLFTADHEQCQRACTHDPGCQFFTFIKENFKNESIRYQCHLKFSWTIPKIPIVIKRAERVSGFSQRIPMTHRCRPACKGTLFPNTNILGHDLEKLPAASPEHCQAYCSDHPLCTYFTFNRHSFQCFLKKNPNGLVHTNSGHDISGLPVRYCQMDSDWMKNTYEGVDFPYWDLRFTTTYDVQGCERACTQDPNCQYYSYIPNPAYRRCYLKRTITVPVPSRVAKLENVVSGFSLRTCNLKERF